MWLARVVYLLVGVAEGWGGRRGYACPCAVLGHAMLRYSVGVGLGVASVGAVVNFIWLWRGWCLVVSMWHQGGVVCRACGCNAVVGP